MEKVVLASSSPRRKELLELIGIPFSIHPSQAEEVIKEELLPSQVVEQLSQMKAKDIAALYQSEIVIGADTIVVFDGKILGKPKNETDAFRMLHMLQGKQHFVYSGITVIDSKTSQSLTGHRVTKVFMKSLTDEEINAYIKTKEPMDKAGSYGIQGIGALFIEKIEGDYYNVVGLPLSLLAEILNRFGIHLIKETVIPESRV